jgi:hypothetical protein
MRARFVSTLITVLLGLVVVGCASTKDTQDEQATEEFSDNKQKVIEEKQREAEERREREKAMREQKEQVDAQLEEPEERPQQPRQTIPESELPTVSECARPGNVDACGEMDGPDGKVRLTASVAPAVMTKGEGQMQMGGVLVRLKEQLPTLLTCYGWAHLDASAESTEYDVEIDVKVDGEVTAASVRATDTPVGAAGCMEERIERWNMTPSQGGSSTIIAPFMFAASEM